MSPEIGKVMTFIFCVAYVFYTVDTFLTCLKKSLRAELGSVMVSLNSLAMALNSSCSSVSSTQNAGLYLWPAFSANSSDRSLDEYLNGIVENVR